MIEGPIDFNCLCEHHALPFFGTAFIGYIAGDQIIGISKLTRLVRLFARRFTVQERLGEQIADGLTALIEPRGVAVHLEAAHLCTHVRGVAEHSRTTTTVWRGEFAGAGKVVGVDVGFSNGTDLHAVLRGQFLVDGDVAAAVHHDRFALGLAANEVAGLGEVFVVNALDKHLVLSFS